METGPPFSCKMKSDGGKKHRVRSPEIPHTGRLPLRKASPAGWIAKRKPSEADDTNIPHISLYLMTIHNLGSCVRSPRNAAHVHTPFARHGEARISSTAAPLFFCARHPKRFVIGCGGFIATVW